MDMKDLEMMAKGGNINLEEVTKMAKGANINLEEVSKMAKGFGIDGNKSADLLGMLGQIDQTQIMSMLSSVDTKSLDINALTKQFGIPAEAIEQFLKMIKK